MTNWPISQPIDTGALAAYLGHQRWFAGKGRPWEVLGTTTLGWLREETPAVSVELVDVQYADGDRDTYQIPVVRYEEPVEHLAHALISQETEYGSPRWLYDALHDKEVTGLWMRGIAESRELEGLSFHRSMPSPEVPLDEPSIVIGAEQSNTSLVFGDAAILKVFRRISPGLNPDIEIHEALAARGSRHVAEPLGWLQGTWKDPATGETVSGSLAMCQVFLHNASEGWELAKASVRDLFAEGDLHADEVGGDFASEAARLGAATAEVHADLAAALGTGFLDGERLARLADAMRGRLDRAVVEVPQLAPYADALRAVFEEFGRRTEPLPVQRIHGDYHLGQVMRTLDGWKLLDFEGEPVKTLAERRAPDSPFRDVAGMLRSFDYASRHLLAERSEPHLEYRAAEWADRNRAAFCEGYGSASGLDPRDETVLIRAFETDKAVYEVVYEARNRPTWLRIPLSAIERLAAAR